MLVEDRYYKIIRIMLKSIGIWPYQNSRWTEIQVLIITCINLSVIFVQLAVFLTNTCTLDLMLNVLSIVFPNILVLFMYYIYHIKSSVMREIMECMYSDWEILKNETEFNIMDYYASIIKQIMKLAFYLLCMGIVSLSTFYARLVVLDFVAPLNGSRVHMHFKVEYFVDQQKYCYPILVHWLVFIFFGAISVISIGMAYFSYCLHACAMFKIANYRAEIAIDKNVLQNPNPVKEYIIHERIVNAVVVHRKAIQYCDQLILNLDKTFLFAIILAVGSLSLNLFRLLNSLTMYTGILDLLISSILVLAHFIYIFLGNHVGQQITNNNAEIFNTVYNLPWYLAPLNIQKLLIFLLQKSHKEIYLSISGIFNASYESFAMLTKVSISYFTIIYAIQ